MRPATMFYSDLDVLDHFEQQKQQRQQSARQQSRFATELKTNPQWESMG